MSHHDTGISHSASRMPSRAQGFDRRNPYGSDNMRTREPAGSSNQKITVDVKDDDEDVQIISPQSVAQARMLKRSRRRATAASASHMDLELTLGTPGLTSQKASTRASRNAIIDLTVGNDDDVVSLPSGKRKSARMPSESSKDVRLSCAICMDSMKEETSTVCGHIFCRLCILQAINAQKKCPTCRRKLTNANIHRIYLSSGSR